MSSSQTSPTSVNVGFPDIALTGKAGAGKSTAADLLVELGYQKRSFAAPLKDIAATLWGEAGRTDRDKLQKLGVAVREIEEDTWADLLVRGVRHRPMNLARKRGPTTGYVDENDPLPPPVQERYTALGNAPIVVDDMRFPNEYWALKAERFVIVRIGAGINRRIDRLKANGKWQDERQLGHVSELALDSADFDYEIDNDGTKDDLYDELVNIILKERRRR